MAQSTINLNDKQLEALSYLNDKTTTQILYGGSAGSGKSFLGSLWLVNQCITYPESRWVLARNQITLLKQTSLVTLFEVMKVCGLKQDTHYTFNQQDNIIKLFNGSEILLKDIAYRPSDPNYDFLGGLEITGAVVEEVANVHFKAINVLQSRMRWKLDEFDLSPKIFMTTNPGKNFVYGEFYKPSIDGTLLPHRKFIQALPTDNPYLPETYIETLKQLDEQSKRRLLYGDWEYSEDALINYDRLLDIFDFKTPKEAPYYLSIDVARLGKDKTTIAVWKGLACITIKELSKQTLDKQVKTIEEIISIYDIHRMNIIVDSDGVGGGVTDFIKARPFNNGGRALKGQNFKNLRSQCYFKLCEMINGGQIKVSTSGTAQKETITRELEVIQLQNLEKDGKIEIISKDKIKQVIGRSPDFADVLMMRMWFEIKGREINSDSIDFYIV
ncbi:phage_term_2, phage terminase, large subunit, PBSX family [uncultured Caudovirales phage]|uniref:Phage_term_2, phage terminase, large subunit, PBSX family n=1 Tax=uncultured Caudovirales phage TaxID=2100421 RepID=A0A6J7WDW4_9CAUD|nr:phage_term_2, phage terminase, large subunit, PBSX family [uncultured Caudovirales phage]